jgi:c-di-GMP-binding flagellar brake protein YcgR
MDESRRSSNRVSYMSEVCLDQQGEKLSLSALDISAVGVGLWGPANCPQGVFEISLPLDDGAEALKVMAEVARQFHSDGGSVWGVRFISLDDVAKRRLKAYVSRQEQNAA